LASINFNQIEYLLAAHLPDQWPEDSVPEVAFAGRSNVGKSSAINAITNRKGLAKTSKTPGRTQQIVFFELSAGSRLVDLPGYGYAKAPEKLRQHWETFITNYLHNRDGLRALVIPMDIRRPLTDLDITMLEYCWNSELPAHVLLTKADKFKRGKAMNVFHSVSRELKSQPRTTVQLFSAQARQGVSEAREALTGFLAE
jgi:GTP-binding protein